MLVSEFFVVMNIQAVKVEAFIFYFIKEPFFVVLILILFEEFFLVFFKVTDRKMVNFASV